MNRIKVSVIIPVYNVEQFIQRCAKSLFEQTTKNDIEFIFINDFSSDKSIEILNDTLKKYPHRIKQTKIFNLSSNVGASSCRNYGLNHANGDFIIFCDSDDWVDFNTYEELYNKATQENADIVCCDFYDEFTNKHVIRKQPFAEQPETGIKDMLTTKLHSSTCNKLVKHSLYKESNITFLDGINMWEDLYTSIRLFFYAKKIAYVPLPLYHYNQQNTGSLLSNITLKKMQERITICNKLDVFFKSQNCYKKYQNELYQRELWAKMEFVTDFQIRDFDYWRKLWPKSQEQIKTSTFSIFNKIVFSLVSNRYDKIAKIFLYIKRAIQH